MIQPALGRMAAEWGDTLKLIQLDVDRNFQLAYQYQIKTLPTLILFKQGVEIKRLSHFSSREDLLYNCERLMHEYLQ
jgi:thioredoxin 1